MSEDIHKATQDLIVDYYRKDKIFNRFLVILVTLAIASGIGAVLIGLYTINKINERTMDIQNQISCVGEFFTQTDRNNLKIPNLKSCNIERVK